MRDKGIILICVFMLLASLCLFADSPVSSTSFYLKHVVNVSSSYYFEFWDPTTSSHITEAELNDGARTVFATLVIVYNATTPNLTMSVVFSDLVNTEDNSFYPYTFEVLAPDTNDSFAEIVRDNNKHGAGTSVLFSNRVFEPYAQVGWDTIEVCDFAITLDGSDVGIGTFQGTLTYTIVAN